VPARGTLSVLFNSIEPLLESVWHTALTMGQQKHCPRRTAPGCGLWCCWRQCTTLLSAAITCRRRLQGVGACSQAVSVRQSEKHPSHRQDTNPGKFGQSAQQESNRILHQW